MPRAPFSYPIRGSEPKQTVASYMDLLDVLIAFFVLFVISLVLVFSTLSHRLGLASTLRTSDNDSKINSWYLSRSMRRVELKVLHVYSALPRVLRCFIKKNELYLIYFKYLAIQTKKCFSRVSDLVNFQG